MVLLKSRQARIAFTHDRNWALLGWVSKNGAKRNLSRKGNAVPLAVS
jgi:hypothetical protein